MWRLPSTAQQENILQRIYRIPNDAVTYNTKKLLIMHHAIKAGFRVDQHTRIIYNIPTSTAGQSPARHDYFAWSEALCQSFPHNHGWFTRRTFVAIIIVSWSPEESDNSLFLNFDYVQDLVYGDLTAVPVELPLTRQTQFAKKLRRFKELRCR